MTPEIPSEEFEAVAPEQPAAAYDVCTPDRLPPDRVAFVDAIQQQFLQTLAQELSAYLDTPLEGLAGEAVQQPLRAFLESETPYAAVMVMELAPMQGQARVGLSGGFLFRVLDNLLGAPQTATPVARTGITEIEQHVLREFFQALSAALDLTWKSSGIRMRMAGIASSEEVGKSADPDGTTLILDCRIKFGEVEETFRVCVPLLAIRLAALESERHAPAPASQEASARATRLGLLSGAVLQMEAVLGGSSIRLGDIAAMQPGQVLMLSQPAGAQLDCLVNGKAKYRGEWIAHGDRHGLQVEALLDANGSVKN